MVHRRGSHVVLETVEHYFLSRPRRFGKSLFLDTIKELFKGLHNPPRLGTGRNATRWYGWTAAAAASENPACCKPTSWSSSPPPNGAWGVVSEYLTAPGRFAYLLAVRTGGHLYLFEFKVAEMAPPGAALAQLQERRYADKYRARGEPIHLIGVEFSRDTRNVTAFAVADG